MWRRVAGAVLFAVLTSVAALGQEQAGYLDVYIAHVKPEKRAEFDAVNKKIADANRRNKGDTWIALETTYGELNTVRFVSTRGSYADVEKAFGAFMGAINKAYGPAGGAKLFQDFTGTLESARSEVRRRRWDLSYNPPTDAAAGMRAVGNARWIRTVIVHVRPGHAPEFEAFLKEINAASQRSNSPGMRWVSEAAEGGRAGTYYISRLLSSLSELDQTPSLQQMLGEEGYEKFQKLNAEAVASAQFEIYRILPEISNPPAETAAAAPDFWNPKPKSAAKPKAEAQPKPAANPNP
ncbi:MAG: hypothetical protein LAP13_26485 [Acidobacteriia bacterium]|nr:hypothetical protein [Terriglobia bacterium]